MFSKFTLSLAVTMSLLFAQNAQAQAKQKTTKKTAVTTTKTKADEAKAVADAAAKKAEEEKALEDKRTEEAKAAAEKAKAVDQAGVYGYIKSHFSASYHGEFYFTRKDIQSTNEDDHDIQDLKIMHNPTIIYRPITNWKILATSEFKYTDAEEKASFINRHYRSLVLVTRENVLTEKEDGITMNVGFGRRIFDRNHGIQSSYGNSRVNTSLSKKFGDKLSTSMLVQYLINDPVKEKIKATTWRHSLELIPSFTYQITDKLTYFFNDDFVLNTPWKNNTAKDFDYSHEMNVAFISYQWNDKNSTYFQFKYLHSNAAPFQLTSDPSKPLEPITNDYFDYYIGHTYSFTPKLSVTGEFGSKIFGAHDGRDFFAKDLKYPEFALYLDYAL